MKVDVIVWLRDKLIFFIFYNFSLTLLTAWLSISQGNTVYSVIYHV